MTFLWLYTNGIPWLYDWGRWSAMRDRARELARTNRVGLSDGIAGEITEVKA